MATRRNRHTLARSVPFPLREYPLGQFAFADNTPMARIVDDLREPVLRALLEVRYGCETDGNLDEILVCNKFFIGRSSMRNFGRSRIKVRYQLIRLPINPRPLHTSRRLSRVRVVSGWIGAGSTGGISLYWRERQLGSNPHEFLP